MKDTFIERQYGAIVVATGFKPISLENFNEYSYATEKDVITSLELERLMNPLVTQKHMIDLILSNPFQAHENKEEKLCQDPNETIC